MAPHLKLVHKNKNKKYNRYLSDVLSKQGRPERLFIIIIPKIQKKKKKKKKEKKGNKTQLVKGEGAVSTAIPTVTVTSPYLTSGLGTLLTPWRRSG